MPENKRSPRMGPSWELGGVPRSRVLKLRFSQNPKRQRGKNDDDFASLTRRVMKKPMPHAKAQLQNSRVRVVMDASLTLVITIEKAKE
jgi:hypothetical protein